MRTTAIGCIASLALLSGCAIQEMKKDNQAAQVRIGQKEQTLAAEEANYRRLVVERDRLKEDLGKAEFSAGALRTQLEQMSRLNDATPQATPEQRAAREERARKLNDVQREAAVVEKDNTKSRAEKEKQLKDLKAKTKAMMDVLLKG